MKKQHIISIFRKNKTMIYMLLLGVFGFASQYIFKVILTHYLTPSLFGDFNLALRVLTILTALSLLGTNISSMRFLSDYLHLRQDERVGHYIKWNIRIIRISFVICVVTAIVSYTSMYLLHIWNIKDIRSYHLSVYMLWLAPLASTLSLLNTYLLCANYPVNYAIVANSSNFSSMIFFLVLVALYKVEEIDSLLLIIVLASGFFLLILLDVYFIMKNAPYLFGHILHSISIKKPAKIDPDWHSVSIRLAINGLLIVFLYSLDIIILKLISPYPGSAGLYAATLTIAGSLFVIPRYIYSPIKAAVARFIATAEGRQFLEQTLKKSNQLLFGITIFLALIILIYSKSLLHHFGAGYVQADTALKILVVGFVVDAFAQPARAVLPYAGQETALLLFNGLTLLIAVVLGAILTYFYDMTGIAIATTLIYTFRMVTLHWIAYHRAKIKTYLLF